MKKYKYLVVCGCSQSYGQHCPKDKIYGKLLADRLGLKLINLSTPATGWYSVENNVTSFIHNNKDIIHECFFILQKSMLDRRVNYEEVSICRTDVWEDLNIKYLSPINVLFHGFNDWKKYYHGPDKDTVSDAEQLLLNNLSLASLPEHRRSLNIQFFNRNINIEHVFEQLMLHWGLRINSFHLFLKNLKIDHIIVDGYSPFLSYKLNFTNYYDTDDEYQMVNKYWSRDGMGMQKNEVVYDFKHIKAGWIFDSIDVKYKIDDVVLWSLYQFKEIETEWNVDGGHAGPKGMELIANVLYKNLINKGWFLSENV